VCLAGGACHYVPPRYDYAQEPDPRHQEYVLGPTDQLRVNIWGNAELSSEVTVRPDGTITLPLIGDVAAGGRTPSQLRVDVASRLGAYVKDQAATVTVIVTGVNSYNFSVGGSVEHAGLLSSRRYVTVAEAIAMAGGPNRFASPERTILIRRAADGSVRRIPIDFPAISAGQRLEQNLVLLSGDSVFVP
jgi:polysaccharide export outer membrane protein